MVANYTNAGEPVADLDHDPHTSMAAVWLGREPVTVDTTDPRRPVSVRRARLVIARLPIVVPRIRAGRYLDRATTVIAAAKAAGLV